MLEVDLYEAIIMIKRALLDQDRQEFVLKTSRSMLVAILDFFQHMDPDMPSAPICKLLGPLVGDVVMNRKLQRLDEIADSIGPQVARLAFIADQMERRP